MRARTLAPDAAACLTEGDGTQRIHFFKGRQVALWDVASDAMDTGSPHDIEDHYPGLLGRSPGSNLRAAVHVPEWGQRIYFLFEGQTDYIVWDIERHAVLDTPVASNRLLPCELPAGEFTPVVAITQSGQRVIFGFHGLEYVRWTVAGRELQAPDTGFPRKTADDWKDGLVLAPRAGVYVEWTRRSAAHSNKKIYFFMGNLYLRWDVPSNTRNYRLDIVAGWPGWPAFV
jgi:hypothetical protein